VLAGKYRVERVLGVGGMGVVVAATHLQLDQPVALKFLLPEAVANAEAASRFLREARNAVKLKSEHVARVIDVGTLDTGAPYIVMEYLEGCDLAGLLSQHRALPIPVAVDYVLQACDAIAEAHSLGIVHRDLKPPNLFMTRGHDGTHLIKVLDFGISKSSAAGDLVATRTQSVMGSPAYMSPEQMRSAKLVDVRTDIWALGIILYQLVLGQVPWEAETFTELCFKVAMDPLPPLPPGTALPPGFEDVVRRCLEKDLNRRFPDIYHLAVALHPYAPPHAQALVPRIGRVLRGETGNPVAKTQIAPASPGTWNEAAGQKVTLPGRRRAAIG
jgi:serine/threonine protein kinase